MPTVDPFGVAVCLGSVALLAAVFSNRLTEWIRIPAPAVFLIAAAGISEAFPALQSLTIGIDEHIVSIALLLILFDGGMHIGWRRFRTATGAIVWVGLAGTFITAAALAVCAHALLGFPWLTSMLIGAALSPTDPAVVFSVLGRREVTGRTGTVLEGESGANDPVGIALMLTLLGTTGGGFGAVLSGVGTFALQMIVGAAVGLLGGLCLQLLMRKVPLPNEALYSLRTIGAAGVIFGVATVLHGSGFLAVFLAGIVIGDTRAPYKHETERFSSALASMAEIVAFVMLGLTIDLRQLASWHEFLIALALAALLIVVIRPLLVGGLLLPIRLRLGERLFVLFAGLKGAVPILLGTFILRSGVEHAERVYGIVFVVVLVSVICQGSLVPTVARWCGVPMRTIDQEPWALGMRFQDEPQGLQRFFVEAGSPADGTTVADLPLGESAWVSMVSRNGRLVQVRGGTSLRAGDEVLTLSDPDRALEEVFRRRQ